MIKYILLILQMSTIMNNLEFANFITSIQQSLPIDFPFLHTVADFVVSLDDDGKKIIKKISNSAKVLIAANQAETVLKKENDLSLQITKLSQELFEYNQPEKKLRHVLKLTEDFPNVRAQFYKEVFPQLPIQLQLELGNDALSLLPSETTIRDCLKPTLKTVLTTQEGFSPNSILELSSKKRFLTAKQQNFISNIREGKNILCTFPTSSGKTSCLSGMFAYYRRKNIIPIHILPSKLVACQVLGMLSVFSSSISFYSTDVEHTSSRPDAIVCTSDCIQKLSVPPKFGMKTSTSFTLNLPAKTKTVLILDDVHFYADTTPHLLTLSEQCSTVLLLTATRTDNLTELFGKKEFIELYMSSRLVKIESYDAVQKLTGGDTPRALYSSDFHDFVDNNIRSNVASSTNIPYSFNYASHASHLHYDMFEDYKNPHTVLFNEINKEINLEGLIKILYSVCNKGAILVFHPNPKKLYEDITDFIMNKFYLDRPYWHELQIINHEFCEKASKCITAKMLEKQAKGIEIAHSKKLSQLESALEKRREKLMEMQTLSRTRKLRVFVPNNEFGLDFDQVFVETGVPQSSRLGNTACINVADFLGEKKIRRKRPVRTNGVLQGIQLSSKDESDKDNDKDVEEVKKKELDVMSSDERVELQRELSLGLYYIEDSNTKDIEDLKTLKYLINGSLNIICCGMKTLSNGINLPIHTVIVCNDPEQPFSDAVKTQMKGRAARKNMDKYGEFFDLNLN
jgi:hypothetical protein